MADWRKTREYRLWRISVIRRDKVCQCCGSHKRRQAHHIEDGSHNPELRFEVDNGITLCWGCHSQFHTNYKHSYREKTTKKDLDNFLLLTEHYKVLFEERTKLRIEEQIAQIFNIEKDSLNDSEGSDT